MSRKPNSMPLSRKKTSAYYSNTPENLLKKKLAEEEEERKRKRDELAAAIGLEPMMHLGSFFYINRSAYHRLLAGFEGVVLPSLFTKAYGRWAIISGLVSHASIPAFLLTNLLYVAPPIALISGIVRFIYVLVKDLYQGKSWSFALQNAAKEAVKTAIKFFIVYMIWTLAIALATYLNIMSGGSLFWGMLLVGVITSLGFTFANFLVDKLPGILADPEKSWASFKNACSDLWACVLPGLMEGISWTLMDSDFVNISAHLGGGALGTLLDVTGISLVVSLCFFVGIILYSSLSRLVAFNTNQKTIEPGSARATSIQKAVKQLTTKSTKGKVAPLQGVQDLSLKLAEENAADDLRLKTTVLQYVQWYMLTAAVNNVLSSNNSIQSDKNDLPPELRNWISTLPLVSCSFLDTATKTARGTLQKVDKLRADLKDADKRDEASKKLQALGEEAKTHRDESFRQLQVLGIFTNNKYNSDLSVSPNYVKPLTCGFEF